MAAFLSKICRRLGQLLMQLANWLQKDQMTVRQKQAVLWHKVQGDQNLRLIYNLTQESIVLDCGGFEGQWSSDIYSKYQPKIYIFEPVSSYFRQIEDRFACNDDIQVMNLGIGARTESIKINVSGDTSSIHINSDMAEEVKIQSFRDFVESKDIKHIDLMKINIEGAEYDLLDHIIANNLHTLVENFQIQFHDFYADYENRMQKIQEVLTETHQLTYQYPLIWENWERKH